MYVRCQLKNEQKVTGTFSSVFKIDDGDLTPLS